MIIIYWTRLWCPESGYRSRTAATYHANGCKTAWTAASSHANGYRFSVWIPQLEQLLLPMFGAEVLAACRVDGPCILQMIRHNQLIISEYLFEMRTSKFYSQILIRLGNTVEHVYFCNKFLLAFLLAIHISAWVRYHPSLNQTIFYEEWIRCQRKFRIWRQKCIQDD